MLVIGAGVIGLTTALCLRRSGFAVTVIADRFAPRVTSVVAGALWEWPPAVCGHHNDLVSLARSKAWCQTSYAIFAELAGDPATGVFLRPVTFYFKRPIEEDRREREKIVELADKVRQFKHDPALIRANGINPELGLRDAYTYLAPMIDTDVYMSWLLGEVHRAGCRIIEGKVVGPLREQAEALARAYGVEAIVNCAGLGARELAEEPVYPLRGALIRVRNDGRTMPRITAGALHLPRRQERGAGLHLHRPARARTGSSWAGWPSPTSGTWISACTTTSRSGRCTGDASRSCRPSETPRSTRRSRSASA